MAVLDAPAGRRGVDEGQPPAVEGLGVLGLEHGVAAVVVAGLDPQPPGSAVTVRRTSLRPCTMALVTVSLVSSTAVSQLAGSTPARAQTRLVKWRATAADWGWGGSTMVSEFRSTTEQVPKTGKPESTGPHGRVPHWPLPPPSG